MSEEITRTPDFQQLIGKKVLSLKHVSDYYATPSEIGSMVLIVEAVDVMRVANQELLETQWRVIGATDETLRNFFYLGPYKVVAVGLVFSVDGYRYHVLVNDTFREVFDDAIPF